MYYSTLRSKLLQKLNMCQKHCIFCFSVKLMDSFVSQDSLDDWNQSETPVIITLPDEPKLKKAT